MQEVNPAKKYLWEYRSIVRRIDALRRERQRAASMVGRLASAWERATRATSRITAVRVSGTPAHDGLADAVMDIIRYKDEAAVSCAELGRLDECLRREIDAAADCLMARLALIDRLTDERQKELLVMRYVEGAAWEKIIRTCDRADSGIDRRERQVFRLHGRALEEIRAMLENGSS